MSKKITDSNKVSIKHSLSHLVENSLLSLEETATCLNMSRRSFYRKRPKLVAGGLKQVRDHNCYKYPASSIRQFIDPAVKTGTLVK